MKIVFFGTPDFAVPSLHSVLTSEHDITAVVTQPDRQRGRGRHVQPCPVKREAQKAGLTVLQPQRVKDQRFIGNLKELNPSAIVVVAYGQILPPDIIRLPRHGCINVHASLLPKYRGAAPINWAIINGEKKTGVSIMIMDEGMDTGPVVSQRETDIHEDDTAGSLSDRLSQIGADVLIASLKGIEDASLIARPQTDDVTYAPLMKKSDGAIQWSKSAESLLDFVRGMHPWPGAFSFLEGKRIKILKAGPVTASGGSVSGGMNNKGDAGVIETVSGDELIVSTGSGRVSIRELQQAGKPPMDVKSFLQGRKLKEGMRFES